MEYLLPTLREKREVDSLIRDTLDKVLVLRFGRSSDAVCLQLDDIVVSRFLFFSVFPFIRKEKESADHTKWVGTFMRKQDFIDVVEAIYRGAMKGKLIVSCPLPPERIPKFQLLYKDL
ncbi:UNVERIFIED_CONTAM: Thioredoxin-like protein 4B [Sesamum calycinum]|uniref:Thioredoxin-like protein 4B n=1 Tax=Sesamum calycinum TaxID=2727403 RepID=A0AAW2RU23_9LAMI